MKLRNLGFMLLLILAAAGCRKNNPVGTKEPPEGSIGIFSLETRHDYYLPLAVVNDTDIISSATINNEAIDFAKGDFIEFTENGFWEFIISYKNNSHPDDTFLFTTKTEEREYSEWGIKAWVPSQYQTVSIGSESLEMFYPRMYADSIEVPFVFYAEESGAVKPVYCSCKNQSSGVSFNLKRGVGSVSIPSSSVSQATGFTIGGKNISASLAKFSGTPVLLSGTIDNPVTIPPNSLVRVRGSLTVTSSGSLSVGAGSVILVAEGADINISGPVTFNGSTDNPVLVTCDRKDKYWGGFITRAPGGTIGASYTFFCRSGYHDSDEYAWGHAGRQALFYTENSSLRLDHCFMTDHIGQIFYPQNATLIFDNILVQRAKTGGQVNYSDLTLRNSVFTDFPDDSYVFRDEDNDALYLNGTDAQIENTTFMFAKDDGLDSGAGDGGQVTINNCWFESCFHEGAALSSIEPVVKHHTITGSVFTNCGQGLELGYSSPNHIVVADNCQFLSNGTGIRYGDNYDWSDVAGKMLIKNSLSLGNDRDVWNMVRKTWSPEISNLSFENTKVSKFCPQYPQLPVTKQ
jgi:hypothetical protein